MFQRENLLLLPTHTHTHTHREIANTSDFAFRESLLPGRPLCQSVGRTHSSCQKPVPLLLLLRRSIEGSLTDKGTPVLRVSFNDLPKVTLCKVRKSKIKQKTTNLNII